MPLTPKRAKLKRTVIADSRCKPKGRHQLVGILDSVERGLERAVNGAFARTFRSGVQPVEIASALKRELDIGAVIVDRDRVLAPNRFTVRVSTKDAERLQNLGAALEQELRGVVLKHAKRQSYQLLGEPDVEVRADESLTTGVLEIDALRVEGSVDWVAAIDVDGTRHELPRGTTTVGRGSDCGIRISDTAASRKHLELIWDGSAGIARDLGSTNGSKINGQRFREAALVQGITITIGQTSLVFQMVPSRDAAAQRRPAPAAPTRPAPAAPAASQPAQPARPASPARPAEAQVPPAADPGNFPLPGARRATPPASNRPAGGQAGGDTPGIDEDFWRGL
ncbi:hypothetical protein GCM10009805_10880 [Leucobacter chromiireducens subsp. solipictus]